MEIFEVRVCQFVSMEKKENFEGVFCLKRSDFVTHYCIVDFSSLLATDIFTGEQFQVLQKNIEGQIVPLEQVELHQNYAVYVNKLDLNQLSFFELWKVKLACFKMNLLGKSTNKNSKGEKQNKKKR